MKASVPILAIVGLAGVRLVQTDGARRLFELDPGVDDQALRYWLPRLVGIHDRPDLRELPVQPLVGRVEHVRSVDGDEQYARAGSFEPEVLEVVVPSLQGGRQGR